MSSVTMASTAPTHALREYVATSATSSAGTATAGHTQSRSRNSSCAAAVQMTSISTPEYVM